MIKRNWRILFVLFSQLHDIAAIGIVGLIIFVLKWNRHINYTTPDRNLTLGLILFAVIYLVIASMLGLYRGSFHLSLRLQNSIMARAFIISLLVALSFNTVSQTFVGKKSVVTFSLLLPLFLFLARFILYRVNLLFQRLGFGVHNSLIAGFGSEADKLYYRFVTFPELGYKVKGIIVKEKSKLPTVVPQYTREELPGIIKAEHIDRIFVPTSDFSLNGHAYLRNISVEGQIKLKVISPQAEDLLKIAKIYDIAGITIASPPRYNVEAVKKALKRSFDIVGSLFIIGLLSPVFVVTMAAIAIESGRPIFFRQRRAAIKEGKPFNLLKFRSMITAAEQLQDALVEQNESDGALFKMKDDPRVTRVGRIIRKLSMDELPQIFNVLRGDMSLVGPRPLPPNDFERANEPDEFWQAIKDRASVKPGMTGLWQISGRSEVKFKEMILLDLYYVENHSILFDIEILFETIPVVLFGRGAY